MLLDNVRCIFEPCWFLSITEVQINLKTRSQWYSCQPMAQDNFKRILTTLLGYLSHMFLMIIALWSWSVSLPSLPSPPSPLLPSPSFLSSSLPSTPLFSSIVLILNLSEEQLPICWQSRQLLTAELEHYFALTRLTQKELETLGRLKPYKSAWFGVLALDSSFLLLVHSLGGSSDG